MEMVDKAVEKARKAIETLYADTCDVFEEKPVMDPETKLTTRRWVKENDKPYPCRLSFKAKKTAGSRDGAGTAEQQIELFIAPEIQIKTGSRLEITRKGIKGIYKKSGVAAVYNTHQEILLEKDGEWA